MKDELDDALCRDFPNTFRDRRGSPRETCMCWGFCCGDGWEPIIRKCAEKIETELIRIKSHYCHGTIPDTFIACGEGGNFCCEECLNLPTASQVKEKFGGLRIYMTSENETITEAIREAERMAWQTCESCGKPVHKKEK